MCKTVIVQKNPIKDKEEVRSKWQVLRWYIYGGSFIGMVFIDAKFEFVECLIPAEIALLGYFWLVFRT